MGMSMAGDHASLHVHLFGPVCVAWEGKTVRPSGLPAQVLAILAAAGKSGVSAERLLDTLWAEAPSSGMNTLQRHVSSLRRMLREGGLNGMAGTVIENRAGSYRLNPDLVQTDLDMLHNPDEQTIGPSHHEAGPVPRWWLEPLSGLPWDPFVSLRARLDLLSVSAAHRWLSGPGSAADPETCIRALSMLAERHPYDELVQGRLQSALDHADGRSIGRTRTERQTSTENAGGHKSARVTTAQPVGADLAPLAAPVSLWLSGRTSEAMAALDKSARNLEVDLFRRASRWLSFLDPADDFARLILGDLCTNIGIERGMAERTLVSLDGYTLAHMSDGLQIARLEVAQAALASTTVRALRVQCWTLLGEPLSAGLKAAVDDLERHDSSTEEDVARFRACLAWREGRFADSLQFIDTAHRANVAANFEAIYHTVLADHQPTRHLVEDGRARPFLSDRVDQSIVDVSHVWRQIENRDTSASTTAALRKVTSEVSPAAGVGLKALFLLVTIGPAEAAELLTPYRGRLGDLPRTAFGQILPAAAGKVALASGDRDLAGEVAAVLEPWAGEYLGLWPLDLLIEPVDDLLYRLGESVAGSVSATVAQ